jgi:hypothetical protein
MSLALPIVAAIAARRAQKTPMSHLWDTPWQFIGVFLYDLPGQFAREGGPCTRH